MSQMDYKYITVTITRFILYLFFSILCLVFLLEKKSEIRVAFASPVFGAEESRINATNKLLSIAPLADVSEVIQLLQEGANVNAVDKDMMTPLMYAARNNSNTRVLNALINEGADINKAGNTGLTALMLAAYGNTNPEIVRILIDKGAELNAVSDSGLTPLMYAARYGRNPEIVRILIAKGAELNAVSGSGLSPLMYAARYGRNPEVMRVLLEEGADVLIQDRLEERALDLANHNESMKKTNAHEFLREKTLQALESQRKTTMDLLLVLMNRRSASIDEVEQLIEEGANVNYADSDGRTPLMHANGENSSLGVIKTLINAGADVNATDNNGMTPFMYAAMHSSNSEALRVLINAGTNVKCTGINGRTPLMHAAMRNQNPEILSFLTKLCMNVNSADSQGKTPLMYAAEYNPNPQVLQVLLEAGANVNAADNNGRTPLILTAKHNSNPMVLNILIEWGANVNATDWFGQTPLMWAASAFSIRTSTTEHCLTLINNGADVTIRNNNNIMALGFAMHPNVSPAIYNVIWESTPFIECLRFLPSYWIYIISILVISCIFIYYVSRGLNLAIFKKDILIFLSIYEITPIVMCVLMIYFTSKPVCFILIQMLIITLFLNVYLAAKSAAKRSIKTWVAVVLNILLSQLVVMSWSFYFYYYNSMINVQV